MSILNEEPPPGFHARHHARRFWHGNCHLDARVRLIMAEGTRFGAFEQAIQSSGPVNRPINQAYADAFWAEIQELYHGSPAV